MLRDVIFGVAVAILVYYLCCQDMRVNELYEEYQLRLESAPPSQATSVDELRAHVDQRLEEVWHDLSTLQQHAANNIAESDTEVVRWKEVTDFIQALILPPLLIKEITDPYLSSLFLLKKATSTATAFLVETSEKNKYLVTVRHVFYPSVDREGEALSTIVSQTVHIELLSAAHPKDSPVAIVCKLVAGGSSSVAGPHDWVVLHCESLNSIPGYQLTESSCRFPHDLGENTVRLFYII